MTLLDALDKTHDAAAQGAGGEHAHADRERVRHEVTDDARNEEPNGDRGREHRRRRKTAADRENGVQPGDTPGHVQPRCLHGQKFLPSKCVQPTL